MENFLALINSIRDSWMSPSSVFIAMDMTTAFMCGAGFFFLLLPFLKDCLVSPLPGSESHTPKVRRALVHTHWSSNCVALDCYSHISWSGSQTGKGKSPERAAPQSAGAGRQDRGVRGLSRLPKALRPPVQGGREAINDH